MVKQISRDVWLAALLFLTLAIILFFSLSRQQEQESTPPLAAESTQPDGGLALVLWMEAIGYTVDRSTSSEFAIPDEADLLMVLDPIIPLRPRQVEMLDDWVEEGGTLLVAGDSLQMLSWLRHFGVSLRNVIDDTEEITHSLTVQTPLWNAPPQTGFPRHTRVERTLSPSRLDDAYIVHTAVGAEPTLLTFEKGAGQVILSTVVYPFTNIGLQQEGNPAFVRNVLALAGEPGHVWYDDWHHGVQYDTVPESGPGFGVWLRTSTVGRSLLLAGAIIFLALVLRGRSFGRPIQLPQQRLRRTPMEYVTAMANLHRRAQHRSSLLQDYHSRLKRYYARRYHLSPSQPDDEFVAELASYDQSLDQAQLARLLAALSNPQISEEQMVELTAEAVDWMENLSEHRKGPTHAK